MLRGEQREIEHLSANDDITLSNLFNDLQESNKRVKLEQI